MGEGCKYALRTPRTEGEHLQAKPRLERRHKDRQVPHEPTVNVQRYAGPSEHYIDVCNCVYVQMSIAQKAAGGRVQLSIPQTSAAVCVPGEHCTEVCS